MNSPEFFKAARIKEETELRSEEAVYNSERREYQRHLLELPIDYSTKNGKEHWGIAADASEGGVLVYLDELIEIGSLLEVKMFFPKRSELNMVKVMTKVVWSDRVHKEDWGENWGRYRYGLAFQSFDKKNLNELNILLEETEEDN
jgi:hypothetical protein